MYDMDFEKNLVITYNYALNFNEVFYNKKCRQIYYIIVWNDNDKNKHYTPVYHVRSLVGRN